MTGALIPLKPTDVSERLAARRAVLVDIREPDEFRRRHVPGALSRPLSALDGAALSLAPSQEVIFTCRSGMRTASACDRLAAVVGGPAQVLEGGVDAWAAAGLPVAEDRRQPLEMMRQVQIGAGGLVLVGVALGVAVHPAFLGLSAFVGAGLAVAGLTGFCGMAKVLAFAPWNRRAVG
jgi:rhodanese-related sulfurtransferase